jgi:two-component system cell cycle sensor histidine kinase/response regulator CckA
MSPDPDSDEIRRATHDLTCQHDLEGNILTANAAAARSLELDLEQLCGMRLQDLLTADALPGWGSYLAAVKTDGVAEGMISLRTVSGRARVWEYRNTLRVQPDGRVVVRGLARDVTDREEALRALRASERQLRLIIENASDIIGIIDGAGRLQFHSPSTERLLGYPPEALAGRQLSELVDAEDVDRTNEFFEEQSSPDAPVRTIDVRVRHADGSCRWFSIIASSVVRSGKATSTIINARDITDRMLLEAQLEQANRLNSLGRLAATVAHEFNNVLMGIQPFADLMQRPGVPPEAIAKGASHITSSILRGKRVALDILRFTNPAEPAFGPVDVVEWWQQLEPEMKASIGNSIELTVSFAQPLAVLADAAQLSQVFSNLISNARHAMPRGGTLTISGRRGRPGESFAFGLVPNAERFVYITVQDSGTGMTAAVLQHAFDPLFTTKQNGGTGLGLAVAHQAVKAHGGHIFVESQPGSGSTFHVFLPATDLTATSQAAAIQAEQPSGRILIVDDEPYIGEGLAELLRDSASAVEVAATGIAAVTLARTFRPELAIVDIRLPDIDGFEVLKRLRADNPEMKVLFASGHGAPDAAAYVDRRTGFIQKPFTIDALMVAIAALDEGGRS